jgi:hypothetical protein
MAALLVAGLNVIKTLIMMVAAATAASAAPGITSRSSSPIAAASTAATSPSAAAARVEVSPLVAPAALVTALLLVISVMAVMARGGASGGSRSVIAAVLPLGALVRKERLVLVLAGLFRLYAEHDLLADGRLERQRILRGDGVPALNPAGIDRARAPAKGQDYEWRRVVSVVLGRDGHGAQARRPDRVLVTACASHFILEPMPPTLSRMDCGQGRGQIMMLLA